MKRRAVEGGSLSRIDARARLPRTGARRAPLQLKARSARGGTRGLVHNAAKPPDRQRAISAVEIQPFLCTVLPWGAVHFAWHGKKEQGSKTRDVCNKCCAVATPSPAPRP